MLGIDIVQGYCSGQVVSIHTLYTDIEPNWSQQFVYVTFVFEQNENKQRVQDWHQCETRSGDLLDFGQLFKAFGNNKFAQILRQFL